MYNLQDASGFGNLGGSSYGGGAGLGFSMPVSPSGGMPICMPMGGCNNGFGGDGIWAILLLALLGRGGFGNDGGFGGGNCNALPTVISDNINGRFSALSDQIAAGDNSVLAAISQNGIVSAVRDVDNKVCETQSMIQSTSAQGRLDTCNSTGLINSNIADVKFQGALAEARTQAQLAACCCDIQRQASENTCAITNAIHADGEATRALITSNTIQDLRDRLQDEKFANSQCAQNSYLVNTLAPRPVPSTPVFANAPMFQPVISAQSICGAPGTSFGGGCGVGNGCF